MWKVSAPTATPRDTYNTCISRVRRTDLKARLQQVEDDVVEAACAYESAAREARLYTIVRTDNVAGLVTRDEMDAVYTLRMAKAGAPGRLIYDALLAAPAYGRCPLCGQRVVSTLDHHLPKAHYPALAVTPLNLVPCCADCNKLKLAVVPLAAADETLHPYFDDIESKRWLHASVVEGPSAALYFSVAPPAEWDLTLTSRVRRHFETFDLARLYASQSAQELSNIRGFLSRLLERAGHAEVRTHLEEMADSYQQARTNSWQTAMYAALASNEWYHAGGLALSD